MRAGEGERRLVQGLLLGSERSVSLKARAQGRGLF